MSSSPCSNPSKMAATDSGVAFGMSRPRVMSVSTGPVSTACTVTPRSASSTRNDCVMLNAAALETEYAGMNGNGASALTDRLLTSAPRERVNSGRNAWVMAYGPNRLTRKMRFEHSRIGQVVIECHAGVVDQNVQRFHALRGSSYLRSVGHIQGNGRDAPIRVAHGLARARVHPYRAAAQSFLY